jgi:hypothetical protein
LPKKLIAGQTGAGTNPCLSNICNQRGALRATIKASQSTVSLLAMVAQMHYTIGYQSEAVQADILGLPVGLQGRYIALTERMCVSGAHLGEPHSSAMGNGLLEVKHAQP